jgi:hypothetical protein
LYTQVRAWPQQQLFANISRGWSCLTSVTSAI